jgi:heptosyltransferase-1
VERNRRLTAAALGYAVNGACDYGLRAKAAGSAGAYAVFLTMTSRADKLWPESHWIELGRALALPVVLPWGSGAERSRAERIGQAIGQAVVPSRKPIDELAEVLANAKGVFGLDSGLTHLAAALGAPTIGIYCASDPALTGLYGAANATNVGAPGKPPQVFQVLKSFA